MPLPAPNQEQIKGQVRIFLAASGGGIAGYFVARGWVNSPDQVITFLNSPAVVGILAWLVSSIWSLASNSQTNAVKIVNDMPEVKGVVTQPTVAGKALADAVKNGKPSATVAPAGSPHAQEIARK